LLQANFNFLPKGNPNYSQAKTFSNTAFQVYLEFKCIC